MFERLKIGTKIVFVTVGIAITVILAISIVSHITTRQAFEQEAFNKLTAVREMKAQQIEDYFRLISRQIIALSKAQGTIDAMNRFETATRILELDRSLKRKINNNRLMTYYSKDFSTYYEKRAGKVFDYDNFVPKDNVAKYLQDIYIFNNPNKIGEKHLLRRGVDDGEYGFQHSHYHPFFADYLAKFGYYDIFLISPESGRIVYSVFKEVDFATSLLKGPHRETNLARAFKAALKVKDGDFVSIVDFEPYLPSYDAPAAFIASPIFDGSKLVGVLAFQMPVDRINDIMTSHQDWKSVGLGVSGETYLVGADKLLRNQSRFLIEDRRNYFRMIRKIGLDEDVVAKIDALNTTIGLQVVDTIGTRDALAGNTGANIFTDYRGVNVLSAYRPLKLAGLNWAIMSEIDESEAFAAFDALRDRLIIAASAITAIIIFVSYYFSLSLTRPLRILGGAAERLTQGKLDEPVQRIGRDEIGDLAQNFEKMRQTLRELIEGLEEKVRERTAEQRAIMDSASDAIICMDDSGHVILWNPAAENMFGRSAKDMLGVSLTAIIPERHRGAHEAGVRRLSMNEEPRVVGKALELEALREDGSEFPIGLSIGTWTFGERRYFTGVIRDITDRKEAEKALSDQFALLEESQSKLRLALDQLESVNSVILRWNPDGLVTGLNSFGQELFGFTESEIVGQYLVGTIVPDGEGVDDFLRRMIDDILTHPEKYLENENKNFRKDGSDLWMMWRNKPIVAEDGSLEGILSIGIDITERKEAEQELEKKETQLRLALDNMPGGIKVVDSDLNYVLINHQYSELYGFPDGLIKVGESMRNELSYQADRGDFGPRNADKKVEEVVAFYQRREAGNYERETAGGRVLETSMVPTPEGNYVTVVTDLTERKRAENAVRENQALLKTVLDNLPAVVFLKSLDGHFQLINRKYEELYGVTFDSIRGKTLYDIFPKKLADDYTQFDRKTIKAEEVIEREVTVEKGDEERFMTTVMFPVFDQQGSITAVGGIEVDITDRKEMEAEIIEARKQAEAANQAKSAFLANMSHELRTPMNAIIGYSEMLAEDAEDEENEDALADLNKIIAAGKHLLTLINDVLDLSKIEAGKMELYTEDFDVSETLNDVTSMAMSLIEKKSNNLATDYGENLGVMHSDMTKIRQNLFNLISNAAKFTENGTITLFAHREARDASDWLVFKVTDTGIGIPEEKLSEIFQEFSQADESTTRHFGGTGLGLALARRFTEMMGGRIWAESVLGEGSSFIMELPATVQAEAETKPEAEEFGAGVKGVEHIGSDTILVVDDDAAARDLMRRNLEREGYRVITAESGEEGIALAKKHTPALITLDVMMPGLDGWAVLSRLKDDPETEDIPVIMVSMLAEEGIGASLGALEHLRKPVDRDELRKVIVKHYQKPGRALIVEDDDATRQIVTKALKAEKWEVAQATNGQEALEIVEREKLDLIILDILMPVMDGFEFLQKFRRMGDKGHVPVVVLTAKDLTKKEKETLSGMATAVLTKSENKIDDLILSISEFMSPSDAKVTVEQSKDDGE